MLSIVGTPIGNLQDMSPRAIQTLQDADHILAEDTRVAKKLFITFSIDTHCTSYHSFSERKHLNGILSELRAGKRIALISDAGMPGISDPGSLLIDACREEGLSVEIIPGPTALISALVLSGWGEHPFQFRGFFPKKLQKEAHADALFYKGVTIFYEAPHRIVETVSSFPDGTEMCIAKELTKKFEFSLRGTKEEILNYFEENEPRGEFVLLIKGYKESEADPCELVADIAKTFSCSEKDAIKTAAELLGLAKRDVYNAWTKSALRK